MTQALPDRTVPDMLDERAAASPDATAFCTEQSGGAWAPVSWRDFKTQAERLAAGLLAQGLRKGDRLALIAPVSLEWELLHHAALRIGIVVVGLDAHDLPARVALMCDTADITAVATTSPGLLAALKPERLQRLRCVILLPGSEGTAPAGAPALPLEQLAAAGAAADGTATSAGAPRPTPADTATIIFTSGTTGDPKGIAYTQAQLCLAIDAIADAFPFVGPGSRLLCWLPLSNLFQRMVNLAGMRRGAASYLLGDPRRVMDVVAGVSPDVFIGVPRFYEKLYQGIQARIAVLPPLQRRLARLAWDTARRATACRIEKEPTPPGLALAHRLLDRAVLARIRRTMGTRLRCMITGSAPTPEYLLRDFYALGWLLLESYGLSENVLPMAMNRVDDFKFGTVGRPLAANEILVGSDDSIAVRGPGVFRSYLGAESAPALLQDGCYRTGDVGRLDAEGFLKLSGRHDEIVKTSTGRKIQLTAIEARLRSVEGIDDAVVIAAGQHHPVAICVAAENQTSPPLLMQLQHRLRAAWRGMAPQERPLAILLCDSPFAVAYGELTSNMKIRRKAIEQNFKDEISELIRSAGKSSGAEPYIKPTQGARPSPLPPSGK